MVLSRKEHKQKLKKAIEEEQAHILVKQTQDINLEKLNALKSAKNNDSVVSRNNAGSQTLTDAVSTVLQKRTDSGASEVEPEHTHQRFPTEETLNMNASIPMENTYNYFLCQNNVPKRRVNSPENNAERRKMKSSNSTLGNIGHINTIHDDKWNRRVRLNSGDEDEKYESDHQSSDEPETNCMESSMRHLRGIRSRDFSQSTNNSGNQFRKRSPNGSGMLFSGLPSNAVIQETLRKQYNNSGISRKDYSKRTRVSVLDSSLSSLYKNSGVGEPSNPDIAYKDMPKGKSNSSGGSYTGQPHTYTNPKFQMNKFKDITRGFGKKNLAQSAQFMDFRNTSPIPRASPVSPTGSNKDNLRDISNLFCKYIMVHNYNILTIFTFTP